MNSRYAATPSKDDFHVRPVGSFDSVATPPTRIVLSVTPGWSTGGFCCAPTSVAPSTVTPTATTTNAAVQRLAPRPRTCVLDIAPGDDPLADTPVLRLAQPNVCVGWPQALLICHWDAAAMARVDRPQPGRTA